MTTIKTKVASLLRQSFAETTRIKHREELTMKSPPLRALCVEDDADTRVMLGIQLKSLGLEVNLAATADEALRWSETKDFDIYLLDSWLPDLDGYELCRQVRQRAPRADRILFFSGAAYELDRQKGIEAGARAYVVKPNFDELLNTLSTLIAEATAVQPEASARRGDVPN